MGCCLSSATTSTATARKTNHPHDIPPSQHHHFPESDANARDPPQMEEETVKEVLSETPIPKPPIPVVNQNTPTTAATTKPEVEEPKIEPMVEIKPTAEEIVSEVSEVSEMYSFTESFSTTVTERREDDGEVTQKVVERSPAKVPSKRPSAGDPAGAKERPVRSAARRSAPSPEKISHIAPSRSNPGRTMEMQRRNVGPPNGNRRDPGEGSGRRSRSPVTRGEVGTRRNVRHKSPGPSLTVTDRSGDRSPLNNADKGGEFKKPNDDVSRETSESLEDPLVSLECFIFL
ncbi:unnamed protein product [Ilex paraguariensis]|uniref:Uncharacterized protein n=1 Tax=Ilex paraguariensis TaxID=185542 RepID=A0ABC8S6E7_9AQUA